MPVAAAVLAAVALAAAPTTKADAGSSLSLAKSIVQLSQRQALVRDTYAKELRAGMPLCKGDAKCQADLDKAIFNAASEVGEKEATSMALLLSQKLNKRQLQASVNFYKSPDGQSIIAAMTSMTDELAQIGIASMLAAQQTLTNQFCPAHPEICSGRKPRTNNKS